MRLVSLARPARSLGMGLFVLAACGTAPAAVARPPPPPRHAAPPGSYPPVVVEPVPGAEAIEAEVRAVLEFQQEAWNAGDIRGFMVGYARHDSLVFISGDVVRRGWQENLYAYMRSYPNRAAMGTLAFE